MTLGLKAFRQKAHAGVTERSIAGDIGAALRQAGSDYWAVPIEMATGYRAHHVLGTPSERALNEGDLIHVEFGAVH